MHICAGLGIPQVTSDMEESKCSTIVKKIYKLQAFFPSSCIKDFAGVGVEVHIRSCGSIILQSLYWYQGYPYHIVITDSSVLISVL